MTEVVTTRGSEPPPESVLSAFGVREGPVRLTGGEGTSWRAGELALKRTDDPALVDWLSGVLLAVVENGFRLARPVPALDGRWTVEGWHAGRWVVGEPGPRGHWRELLVAARAFHRALRNVERSALLDARDDVWARADRAAWGEADLEPVAEAAPLADRLLHLAGPSPSVGQLVHGDLSGNVLFRRGLPPAILDVSPYWRPAAYAEAVAVADGLLWWREGRRLLDVAGPGGHPGLVARALLFRLLVTSETYRAAPGAGAGALAAALRPFGRVTSLLEGGGS